MNRGLRNAIAFWFMNLVIAIVGMVVIHPVPFSEAGWWMWTWYIFWGLVIYAGLSNCGFVFGIFGLLSANAATNKNWLGAGSAGLFAAGDYMLTKSLYEDIFRKAEYEDKKARYDVLANQLRSGEWFLMTPGEKSEHIWEMYKLRQWNGYDAPFDVYRAKLDRYTRFERHCPDEINLDDWQDIYGDFPQWFMDRRPDLVKKTKYYGQL